MLVHSIVSTTQCYPSMLRIVLLHIDWSCCTWHKIVRPSMGPHYQRVAQSPSTYSNIWRSVASLHSKKPNNCWGYLLIHAPINYGRGVPTVFFK